LGKAALLAGGAYFAPTLFGKSAGFGNFGNLLKGGITQAFPAAKSFLVGKKHSVRLQLCLQVVLC
jgi:hypothetical protein